MVGEAKKDTKTPSVNKMLDMAQNNLLLRDEIKDLTEKLERSLKREGQARKMLKIYDDLGAESSVYLAIDFLVESLLKFGLKGKHEEMTREDRVDRRVSIIEKLEPFIAHLQTELFPKE